MIMYNFVNKVFDSNGLLVGYVLKSNSGILRKYTATQVLKAFAKGICIGGITKKQVEADLRKNRQKIREQGSLVW